MVEIYELKLSEEEIAQEQAWQAAAPERAYAEVQRQREAAYRAESDVLRDYWLRDENGVTKEDWIAKVEEIRQRYPYPTKDDTL